MRTPHDQLVHFLSDMYSVELQALAQLVSAPKLAGDPSLAADYETHYGETQRQADLVRARLEAAGGSPSAVKDAVMKLGGKSFLAFAKLQPETPGRLAAHAYSYEAMEWAGYEMLLRMAGAAGDAETARAAREIRDEERTMMERLERGFDAAERASHERTAPEDMAQHVRKHLAEAHALEAQSIKQLERGESIAGDLRVEKVYTEILRASRANSAALESRLKELGGDRSRFKDAVLAAGGLDWGLFFQAQSDTPTKLAAFVYAFEHLKIGGYELLRRSARRAGDGETERLCGRILEEERALVQRLADTFDEAVRATLETVGSRD